MKRLPTPFSALIDKLASVAGSAPRAVGMFLANGSIDDELLGILRDSGMPSLRWFDLTTRDVMERIEAEIVAVDGAQVNNVRVAAQPSAGSAPTFARVVSTNTMEAESARLKAMKAEFEEKLRELDKRRSQETQALMERLEKLANETKSPRYDSVRGETEISPERARASYEAMLEEPTLNKKLRYLGAPLLTGIMCILFGLAMLVARDPIAEIMASSKQSYGMAIFASVFYGISIAFCGVWWIWRRYSQVEDYFEFSRQTIRDLYVRDVPIGDLARVNTALRRAIDRYGAYRARETVIRELRSSAEELPPPVRDYFENF